MEENHPYPDIHRRLEYNLRGCDWIQQDWLTVFG